MTRGEMDGKARDGGAADKGGALEGFARRIEILRGHYAMGQRKFADWLGLPPTTYHEYAHRKRKPLLDAIARIIERTGVSADWLIAGKGPMFAPQAAHAVIREMREARGLSPGQAAAAMGLPEEKYAAFESGEQIPDLAADFEALSAMLAPDPVARQRLFDAVERDLRPAYWKSLVQEEPGDPGQKTPRFGKFLEPRRLRDLLDSDEEAGRLYMAQPLAKKASLVMCILRNGVEDPAEIRRMICDNFSEIRLIEQFKALLGSKHRAELVSFMKFLLHRAGEPADS